MYNVDIPSHSARPLHHLLVMTSSRGKRGILNGAANVDLSDAVKRLLPQAAHNGGLGAFALVH